MKKKLLLYGVVFYATSLIAQSDDAVTVFKHALENAIEHPTNQMAQEHVETLFMMAICKNHKSPDTVMILQEIKNHESSAIAQLLLTRMRFECPLFLSQIEEIYNN